MESCGYGFNMEGDLWTLHNKVVHLVFLFLQERIGRLFEIG